MVVVAAVLGPTYLGNVFQASNNLPNLVYMALIGALISSLLVPPLIRLVDEGDRAATDGLPVHSSAPPWSCSASPRCSLS